MKHLAFLLVAAATLVAGPLTEGMQPRVIYSKSFPGSTPAWVEVTIEKSGAGIYKEDPKDEDPLKLQLSDSEANDIFVVAEKLNRFSRPLESHLKVANMGMKTLRYEADGKSSEVRFNYSEDPDARTLVESFERIVETERELIELERTVRFDKLGVQDAILRIEITRNQKRLVSEQQFLPWLDRVAKNESFLHMARERAAALADSIRAAK